MSSPPPIPPSADDLLLEQAGWVRRLAYRLVRDTDAAEDLAQDAFVRALEHPPEPDRPVRGWLATVMRNLVAQGGRRSGSRRGRDEIAARADSDEAAAEIVVRATSQRQVADLVLGLPEPVRSTVLLRYFDELPAARIAARQSIPVATVKARLARGRAALRAKLDDAHGGDARAWLVALLPAAERAALLPVPHAAPGPAAFHPLPIGALLVNVKILIAVLAAALVGTLAVVATRDGATPPAAAADRGLEKPDVELVESEGLAPAAPDGAAGERLAATPMRAAGPAATSAAAPALAPAAAAQIHGRVVDAHSRPVAGVRILRATSEEAAGHAAGDAEALSGPAGEFALPVTVGGGQLVVSDERWTTVLAGSLSRSAADREIVVVVAPRVHLAGLVVEALGGLPVADALLAVHLPDDFRADFALDLDYATDLAWSAESAADGAFTLDAPWVEGARLTAAAADFRSYDEALPAEGAAHVVVLERLPLAESRLRGRVIDAAGTPVAGASVSLSVDVVETDAAGEFEFDLAAPETFNRVFSSMAERLGGHALAEDTLFALAPGALPAVYTAPRSAATGAPLWPAFVTLRLGTEPFALAGRVIDADGEPVEGAQVWVADPTFFGGLGRPAAGQPNLIHVETLLAGRDDRSWSFVETDAEGRFRIDGLQERAYRLEAMHPDTLLRVVLDAVPAGRENVVIELPEGSAYPALSGTVVAYDGEPLANVSVFPMCDSFVLTVEGMKLSTYHSSVDGTTTDANGRFELVNVPKDLVYLRLQGADVLPLEWGRHVEGGLFKLVGEKPKELVITVGRRCQFQVELDERTEADSFALLGGDGTELEISEFVGTGRREGPRKQLHEGRSNPMAASDEAATLVLYLEDEEVVRVPVRLTFGERVTLRP